ncbi:MAG TPA: DinB family protein [Candidatus Janibacter merdipullorum]|nr:DinB family protein [Candidatus Janibacter merdipullorum]
MYFPDTHDEITGYAEYVDQQLEALRASAFGLTEEQARLTPTRSALSIGGIIKHTSFVIAPPEEKAPRVEEGGEIGEDAFAAFMDTFALRADETLVSTLETFDRRRLAVVEWIRSCDPDMDQTVPPAPWYGLMNSSSAKVRYSFGHFIEELARHAGHADIIREQIDGATTLELVLADTGRPATPFAQPWTAPEPATS